jgi:hypothetical protein
MSAQSHTWDHVCLNWLSGHAIDTETRGTSRACGMASSWQMPNCASPGGNRGMRPDLRCWPCCGPGGLAGEELVLAPPRVVGCFGGGRDPGRERAVDNIARPGKPAARPGDFWQSSAEVIAGVLPYYWTPCWYTLDPASLLITSHFHDGMLEFPAEWLAEEYYADDVLSRFTSW